MLTKERVLELLHEQGPLLSQEYGVSRVGLFGSFARGEADASSDVDLVLEFERPIGLRFVDLVDHLEGVFGRKVDVLTPAGIRDIRRSEVRKGIAEGILYVD